MISNNTKQIIFDVTANFEGGGWSNLSGNFDGQGISHGLLQQCLGQRSLQPIWKEALNDPSIDKSMFDEVQLSILRSVLTMSKDEQVAWGDSISDPGHKARVVPEWRTPLKAFGEATKPIQMVHADAVFERAIGYCNTFKFKSIRALSFMFDICVQNGSIQTDIIESVLKRLSIENHHTEKSTLLIILDKRLDRCKPQWREDVKLRKECIINGSGWVHEELVNVDDTFGVSDEDFDE